MRPETLVGLLAEEDRLRTYAAIVLGAGLPSEVAAATGLPAREVVRALRRLEQGGLVEIVEGRLRAAAERFKEAARESAPPGEADVTLDPDRTRDAVLRAFLREGRIVAIPAARAKRRVVLEHVAASFEPGVRYPERAVNALLRAWHDDYVTLRRFLVDDELLSRAEGVYWRSGGPVEV